MMVTKMQLKHQLIHDSSVREYIVNLNFNWMTNLQQHKRALKDLTGKQKLTIFCWLFWNPKAVRKYHECVIKQWYGNKAFIEAQKNNVMSQIKLAEAQLIGFSHASRGFDIKTLADAMALTKKEWLKLRGTVELKATDVADLDEKYGID